MNRTAYFEIVSSGALRAAGHIIEAHEVTQNKRYDEEGGDMVNMGIMGTVAMAMQDKDYGKTGSALVGDEIAAGVVASFPKKDKDELFLLMAMLLSGR